jgi:Sulfotransferase domain
MNWLGCKSVPKGYSPITELSAQDVFVVGYPKSGNTWFQHLVAAVVYGVDPRWSPPLLANDLVPDVHFNRFYRRYATPMFFKSHHLPLSVYRRVVYLLRDGRDVMVSYFHFLEAVHKRTLDFRELVRTGSSLIPCKWHEHVEAWRRNPYGADMLIIRYEDLLDRPVEELDRFCRFIQLRRDREFLSAAAEAARFETLRAKEAQVGMGCPDRWPAAKFFFRRGKAGSYKDEMPRPVLELFVAEAAEALRQNGYAIS